MPAFQNGLPGFNLTELALNDSRVKKVLQEFLGSDHLTSKKMEAVLVTIYSLISLTALVANSVIVTVIIRTKRLCVPTHLLLLNLMIADLLLSTVCMPFTLISFIRKSWPFGWICCKIIPLIQGTAVFASSITIAVIAADRWYRITSGVPVNNNNNFSLALFSRKKLFFEVALIWLASVCCALPMAIFQVEVEIGFPGIVSYPKCIEKWPNHSFGFYSLTVLVIQLIIPMTCLLVSFFKIRNHLQHNLDKMLPDGLSLQHRMLAITLRRGSSNESTLTTLEVRSKSFEELGQEENRRTRILREIERNRKVTNILLSVSASFIFCWMPWNAINILMDFEGSLIPADVAYALLATCHIIAMLSAVANPLLYGYTNTNIRRELRFRTSSPESSS